MKTLLQTITAIERQSGILASAIMAIVALALCLTLTPLPAAAQTAGEGAIEGSVTDFTGAVIPYVTVTAVNTASGVAVAREATGEGYYVISPLIPGTYTVTASTKGFSEFRQENLVITAMQSLGLNIRLKVGNTTEVMTVTAAPPELQTTSATLGSVIDSSVYMDLPILTNNQQRDITGFSNLLPGAQPGTRTSEFSGTASRVQEVYLDGVPLSTINQIGDNRPILNIVPSEAIGEINVITSNAPAEYQGAGMVNYTMKSGGNQYHGTVAAFARNTVFDTWGFTAPAATKVAVVNGVITNVPAGKPGDHQNEFTVAAGGPLKLPHVGHDKLFFFGAYDMFRSRSGANPQALTVPTAKMRTGDFSELLSTAQGGNGGPGYIIYDPTTQAQCTANSTTGPCRYAYGQTYAGTKGANGNPTGKATNVIPAGEVSPIATYMEQWLPTPTLSGPGVISGNYLGGNPSGYNNWLYSGRVDYDVSPRQRISGVVAGGNRQSWPFTGTSPTNNSSYNMPLPYTGSDYATVAGHWADIEDSYTFTEHLVNQFRFGWSNFGGPPTKNLTEGVKQYELGTAGVTFNGAPADGQAVDEFPTVSFTGSNAPNTWGLAGSGQSITTVTQNYTTLDNLLLVKGNHAMTFGFQMQRLEFNSSAFDSPLSTVTLNESANDTTNILPKGTGSQFDATNGYSYASFMLGAVDSTSNLTLQPFSVLGARYRNYAPYFQDDWKITHKLTLNLGLRWDYMAPYHETLDRFSYLNPNITNPVTGNPGALEFAGSWGGAGVSCNCDEPFQTYWKNFGPHVGFAYQLFSKTVMRGGFATLYSHAGGLGGAGGAGTGPSQNGFTSSNSFPALAAGTGAAPNFYLNNGAAFQAAGISNVNFGGPTFSLPPIQAPGAVSQTLGVGNTVNSTGAYVAASSAPTYADFYLSGRAPEFNFWNFGFDQAISNNLSVSVDYAGSESHFIAGASNMRGLYSGQLNPIYYALGAQINNAANAANVAKAQAIVPSITVPYANFEAAATTTAGTPLATIGRMLTWMPQFSGTSDTWGADSANSSYHALQVSAHKRVSGGLDLTANYTYSKNIDNAGTQRSGYAIPANLQIDGRAWAQDKKDRSLSANSLPQSLAVFGTYHMPFGTGSLGGSANPILRQVIKGWELGSVFTYRSGTPLLVTSAGCKNEPMAGTCMPDLNPNFTGKSIRQNGKWGQGITGANLTAINYLQGAIGATTDATGAGNVACAASTGPFCNSQQYMIGNAPRTMAFNDLRSPYQLQLDGSVRRTFDITERWKFVFAADCQNIPNKVTFGTIDVAVDDTTFGAVKSATGNTGSRDFQFSGRINF